MIRRELLIEGYASVFGETDLAGDVVRAGAFAASLARLSGAPMLFQHRPGKIAGRWLRLVEDGRGLKVRGIVTDETPFGAAALDLIEEGRLGGLSIGFVARDWRARVGGGRVLKRIDLREVSLVASPMLPSARFTPLGETARVAEDQLFEARRAA